MVAAVHYFATVADQGSLLDYLGEPTDVTLCPWPVLTSPPAVLARENALETSRVMIVSRALGAPIGVRPGSDAMAGGTRAGLFNRLNWGHLRPSSTESLVDSNTSPVMLWTPGESSPSVLHESSIGSQADVMAVISAEYERWANRVMGWVRRRGTKVWGLQTKAIRPDLDVELPHISAVYALPDALAALERGMPGR